MLRGWMPLAALAGMALTVCGSAASATPQPLTESELDQVVAGATGEVRARQLDLLEFVIIPHLSALFRSWGESDTAVKEHLEAVLAVLGRTPSAIALQSGARMEMDNRSGRVASAAHLGGAANGRERVLRVGNAVVQVTVNDPAWTNASITAFATGGTESAAASERVTVSGPGNVSVPPITVSVSAGN